MTNQETFDRNHTITFCVNLESKQLVQMSLTGKPFFRPDPKVDVVPELETDYRKRTGLKIFVNTNAPAQLLPTKPFNKAE